MTGSVYLFALGLFLVLVEELICCVMQLPPKPLKRYLVLRCPDISAKS